VIRKEGRRVKTVILYGKKEGDWGERSFALVPDRENGLFNLLVVA
jgi:hypothetical protein